MSAHFVHDCQFTLIAYDGVAISTTCEALQICTKLHIDCLGDNVIHVNVKGAHLTRVIKEYCENGFIDCGATTIQEWMLLLCAAQELGVLGLRRLALNTLKLATSGMSPEEEMIAYGLMFKVISTDGKILHMTDEASKYFWSKEAGFKLGNETPIEVSVAANQLEVLIRWAEHHKMEKTVLICQWDYDFLNALDARNLMKVLCASNIIGIFPLQRLCMKIMNEKTEGYSTQELCIAYGLSYKLMSTDGCLFYLSEVASKLAPVFCEQGHKMDTEEPIIMDMNSSTLVLIIQFCEQHRTDVTVTEWDKKFLEAMTWENLTTVCIEAHKLGIQSLYSLTLSVIEAARKRESSYNCVIKMETN